MPEIIDILTLPAEKSDRFTVDKSLEFVSIVAPPGPDYTFKNASNKGIFLNGDNLTIVSAGFILPEAFTFYKNPAQLSFYSFLLSQLAIKGISGDIFKIDVLGTMAGVYIPLENYEISINTFVDLTKQKRVVAPHIKLNENFSLFTVIADTLKISMKAIPATYDGKTFIVSPFFKILHNFSLI